MRIWTRHLRALAIGPNQKKISEQKEAAPAPKKVAADPPQDFPLMIAKILNKIKTFKESTGGFSNFFSDTPSYIYNLEKEPATKLTIEKILFGIKGHVVADTSLLAIIRQACAKHLENEAIRLKIPKPAAAQTPEEQEQKEKQGAQLKQKQEAKPREQLIEAVCFQMQLLNDDLSSKSVSCYSDAENDEGSNFRRMFDIAM